jgi:metallo-beta-lactamase family protein
MRVSFHGAAGEVTGSLHEIEAAGQRLLLDCGMIQGGRGAERRNAERFDFDPASLDAVVLSHVHLDHCGRLPLLVKRGFSGPVFMQKATAALLPIMLLDAASSAESEAERDNRRRPAGAASIEPLFTTADAHAVLERVQPLAYSAPTEILPGVQLTLHEAGHILGSSVIELRADGRTLVYSGDLGQAGTPILRDPCRIEQADLVLLESTYGDRNHRQRDDTIHELGEVLEQAWTERGNVLLPAFAVGRTQELLFWFARHWDDWNLARWRIFLDSPMATRVTDVYAGQVDLFDDQARQLWQANPSPFELPNLHYTASVEESMAINRIEGRAIIIAGSGMASGGRILHLLKHNLGRREAHVVFVGYQAEGTLGRRLVDGARWVRIHGHDYHVNATTHTIGGLSAHADQAGLLAWYGQIEGRPPVALVHGEQRAREALAGEISERFGVSACLPDAGDSLEV